ncbi:hypothetical protein PG5_54140 [Pseudomonas sp. G5(2012)]|nr:hypothetical protein PG5_54140 [Pseudomonas sp. G5(2012)]
MQPGPLSTLAAAGKHQDQKIAACGSSYMGLHFLVGAAAGCDLCF